MQLSPEGPRQYGPVGGKTDLKTIVGYLLTINTAIWQVTLYMAGFFLFLLHYFMSVYGSITLSVCIC